MKNKKWFSIMMLVAVMSVMNINVKAQSGSSCGNAIILTPSDTINPTNFLTSGNEIWFSFIATSAGVVIIINNTGNSSQPKINLLSLYENTCSTLNLLASASPTNSGDASFALNASNLILGNIYILKAEKNQSGTAEGNVSVLDRSGQGEHSLFICSDGTVRASGSNDQGQLGDGTIVDRSTPVVSIGLTNIIKVAVGGQHSLALKNDGTVWAWGADYDGQLGDNVTFTYSTVVVQVHGTGNIGYLTDIIDIAAGGGFSLALKCDGSVWAWGTNGTGELGDNTTINESTPVQVHGAGNIGYLSGIVAISTGSDHAFALKNDGTLWAWGYGGAGILGDNTINSSHTPIQVHGENDIGFLTNVAGGDGGSYHSIALKNDGSVWAWGDGLISPLGDGTTNTSHTPVHVHAENGNPGFLTSIVSVAAAWDHKLALKNDGTVWAWGNNLAGQLGDGTISLNRVTPVQVIGLTGIVSVRCGLDASFAVKNDGTIWSWGWNSSGQLGDGTTITRNAPVQVLTGCLALISACRPLIVPISASNFVIDCGQSSNLSVSPCGGTTPYTYSWSPSASLNNSTISNPTATPLVTTTYTVIVTDANGCTSNASIAITVQPSVTVTASSTPVCENGTIILNASGSYNSYFWNGPNGYTSNAQNPTVTNQASQNETGVYTVVATDFNGCTGTASINVTLLPAPTIIVSAPVAVCRGQSVMLSASGVTGSYAWSPPDGLSSTTGQSVTATPNSTTTYTVSGSGSNGCTGTATTTVTILNPPPFQISGNPNTCDALSSNTATYCVTNFNSSYTYQWSVAPTGTSFTISTSTDCITVDWSSAIGIGGSITCNALNTSIFPPCTTQATLTIYPCCLGDNTPTTVILPADITSSDLYNTIMATAASQAMFGQISGFPNVLQQSPGNPREIVFNGNLILNSPFSFIDCPNIKFAVDKGIINHNDHNLNILGSHLMGCDMMWKGIENWSTSLIPVGSVVVDASPSFIGIGSVIEDAVAGVSNNNAQCRINSSTLKNNYIDVLLIGTNASLSTFEKSYFRGGGLKPSIDPSVGTNSNIGIFAVLVRNLDIGTQNPGNENYFEALNIGVNVVGSSVNVYRNNFININPLYPGSEAGSGVAASPLCLFPNLCIPSDIVVKTGAGVYPCNWFGFQFSKYGVYSNNSHAIISENCIELCETGILSLMTFNNSVKISDNNISDVNYGIDLQNNTFSSVNVSGNKILVNATPIASQYNTGIRVTEYPTSPSNNYISDNEIAVRCGSIGISAFTAAKTTIVNNFVQFMSPVSCQPTYGIYTRQSPNLNIICNTVANTAPSGNHPYGNGVGYYIEECPKANVSDNRACNMLTGFYFLWNNPSSHIFRNIMETIPYCIGNFYYGMFFQDAIVGPQGDINLSSANVWNGNFQNVPYACGAATNNPALMGLTSPFYVTTIPPVALWQQPVGFPSQCGVTFRSSTGTAHETGGITCDGLPRSAEQFFPYLDSVYIDSLDKRIAMDSLLFNSPSDSAYSEWSLNKYLFKKLSDDTTLVTNDSVISEFFSSTLPTPIGRFTELENRMNKLWLLFSSNDSIKKDNDSIMEDKREQMLVNDSLVSASSDSVETAALKMANESLASDITQLKEINDSLIHQNLDLEKNSVEISYALNDFIESDVEYEQNLKTINEIYLRTVGVGNIDFTETDREILTTLSGTCPLTGGPAVYNARALLRMFNDSIEFDDIVLCNLVDFRMSLAKDTTQESGATVYPNPATEHATLRYSLNGDNADFVIYSSFGQKLVEHKLTSAAGEYEFDVHELPSGIYFYNISQNNASTIYGKFVILR